MNINCLNCRDVRCEARVQGGCATPMFKCQVRNEYRTHLMPGRILECFEKRDSNLIDPKIFEPDYSKTHA